MSDNYMKAFGHHIMWWPLNQECIGCVHKCDVSLPELQELGMFTEAAYDDEESYSGIPTDEQPLALHASKCEYELFLGMLGTGEYNCPEYSDGRSNPHE